MNEENINTTQRQIQEQKTSIKAGPGHWIGEVMKWGFLFFLLIVGIMVFLWVFGGDNGQYTDIGIWVVLAGTALWWIYHGSQWIKHKAEKAELDSHFHDVSPILSIGDRVTEGFTPFYVPQFPTDEVKEEFDEPPRVPEISQHAAPILTLSQQREKQIQTFYDEGKTMAEIVKIMKSSSIYDPPTMHDVRVALGKTGKENQE